MTDLLLYPIPVPPPARLSIMPRPRGNEWLDDEMVALRQAGVDVLVCLQTAAEREELGLVDEPDAASRAGLSFYELPIEDFGVPDRTEVEPLLNTLLQRLTAGEHVAVHCRGGVGRSSLIAAAPGPAGYAGRPGVGCHRDGPRAPRTRDRGPEALARPVMVACAAGSYWLDCRYWSTPPREVFT